MDKLVIFPIAIILGSDKKPAKLRLFSNNWDSPRDIWIRSVQSLDRYGIAHDNRSYAYFRVIAEHTSWLPICDMYNNLVLDGIFIAPDEYRPNVISAIDRNGNVKEYSIANILKIARKDKNRRVFCNLDYDNLDKVAITNNKFAINEFSGDLNFILAGGMSGGVSFQEDGALVKFDGNYFNTKSVILPDFCTGILATPTNAPIANIVFPEKVGTLILRANNCANLNGIKFPSQQIDIPPDSSEIDDESFDKDLSFYGWLVHLVNCNSLKNLEFSANTHCNALSIQLNFCDSVQSIVTPEGVMVSVLDLNNCKDLRVLNIARFCYGEDFGNLMIRNCENIEELVFAPSKMSGEMSVYIDSCPSLKRVSLSSNFKVAEFSIVDCPALETLDIARIFDVTQSSVHARDCGALKQVRLHSYNQESNVYFDNCPSLDKLTLKGYSNVHDSTLEFFGCTKLRNSGEIKGIDISKCTFERC